jgi:hypothetical protein
MNSNLIILGTASTLISTPFDLEDTDYWACAPVITHRKTKDGPLITEGHRIDILFEMHNSDYWTTIIERLNNFVDKHPNVKIYMQEQNSQIKNCVKYPLAEVQCFINHPRMRNFLTSTIAYMVVLAIMQGYKSIEMYGIHMSSEEEEYSLQRECMSTLLGFAWGKGVDFWLPEQSDIMKSDHLYGYEQDKGIILKTIRYRDGVALGEKQLEKQLQEINERYWQQKGGVAVLNNFIKELRK